MLFARILLDAALVYLFLGLAWSIPFVLRGVNRIDETARDASPGFRLMILPGTVALWPWLLAKWLKAPPDGVSP
jgi:hypothetical protein